MRTHGNGSIQKRGSTSWRLRYYDGDDRHEVTFRGTKKEAEAKLRELLGTVEKGTHVAPAKQTLAEWAADWIALKATERQHRTYLGYEDILRRHVLPVLGNKPLQSIRPLDVQMLYSSLTELAPRTRHHVGTILKACLQQAVALKLISSNPAADIKKPSAPDSDIGIALDQADLVRLIEGFRGSTIFDLIFLMAFTGMRRGEALALRWSDFDPVAKTLRIERALEYTKQHGLQFKPPKSERSKRTIKLDDELVALLCRLRDTYIRLQAGIIDGADLALLRSRGLPDDWLVFPAPDGQFNEPRHPDAVTKQFMLRAEKILGRAFRLHDLRVSHGTWLLDHGTPVHVVAKRLGHDAAVLLKIYAKRTQRGDESAAETIGQLTKGLLGTNM